MRLWKFAIVLCLASIFFLCTAETSPSEIERKRGKDNEYVYDDDSNSYASFFNRGSNESTEATTWAAAALDVATNASIINAGPSTDVKSGLDNSQTSDAINTTTSVTPVNTTASINGSMAAVTEIFGDAGNESWATIGNGTIRSASGHGAIGNNTSVLGDGSIENSTINATATDKASMNGTSPLEEPKLTNFSDSRIDESLNLTVSAPASSSENFTNATAAASPINITSTASNETGLMAAIDNANFTSESGGRRFLVPTNFSEHEIVEETNITGESNATRLMMNDGVNITATQDIFNVSQGGNGTAGNESLAAPVSFNSTGNVTLLDLAPVDGNTSTGGVFSGNFSDGDQSNETIGLFNQSSTLEPKTTDHVISTTSATGYDWESEEHDALKGNNHSCSYRSSSQLSPFEHENLVVLRGDSIFKWTNESEAAVCHFLLSKLCEHFTRFENASSCDGVRLDIIDDPSTVGFDPVLHLLARGPYGDALNGKVLMGLLEEHEHEMRSMLASLLANVASKDGGETTASVSSRPYEHPLDNPVIATSLIAVVVTVCLVAMLSLLILVLLQRRRRGRKGEWIVNKKNRGINGSGHQAYGWCFENDAYANDEKKRPMAPPMPPVQLLDDHRQRIDLPVDSPPFDVKGSVAFPVPPPPPMNSFNGMAEQLPPPPPPHANGNSFSNWGVQGEAMEMTETGHTKNQRWY